MMKIAYLVNMYPKVSHTFIRNEIAALESQGAQVVRFSVRDPGEPLVDEADVAEREKTRRILDVGLSGLLAALARCAITRPARFISALRLAWRSGRRSDRGRLVNLVYLAEACALLRWMIQDDVEHLHAHFGTNPTAVAMLCRALGGPPYSFTVHGPGEFDRATVLALDRKIANARFVVAISQFGRSQLYRWADYKDWPKIQVVHCGLNDSFIDAPHTELPDTPRLVCVGRLCEQKGQLLLIEAAAKLHREGVDFALTLVGDGEMRSACEQLIRRHHLTERVTITGWASADQVRRQLIDARALVLPSFAEGLPVVIMEALALGRPVISSYVAGIPELVRPGECGWLVPAGDIDALATAMRDALSRDVDELTQMGAAGRTLAQREHNVHVEAAKLLHLFSTGPTSNTAEEESPGGDSHALNRTTLMESTT